MIKRWVAILLAVALLTTGCTRFAGDRPEPSVIPTVGFAPTSTAIPLQPAAAPTIAPTPDFSLMTFVEKNNLYLQLLGEKQTAGANTSDAEEAYTRSLEASLEGNSVQADEYLEQAILILWNQ